MAAKCAYVEKIGAVYYVRKRIPRAVGVIGNRWPEDKVSDFLKGWRKLPVRQPRHRRQWCTFAFGGGQQ